MPQNAAGWRIEPPVSVPVAPTQSFAATAAAEPPDEPPGTSFASAPRRRHGDTTGPKYDVLVRRAHGELVVIEFAEQHRAIAPQIGGDGRFVGGNEVFQDVRARRGAHTGGAEQILDAERQPFERPALAFGQSRIRGSRHVAGAIRRFQHKGVKRTRLLDGGEVRIGQFGCGKFLRAQRIARLRQRERGEIGHPVVLGSSQENLVLSSSRLDRQEFLPFHFFRNRRAARPVRRQTRRRLLHQIAIGRDEAFSLQIGEPHRVLFTSDAHLFHHFRHKKEVILARRRIRHDGVGDAAVGHLVLTHLHRHRRHRRHWLDARNIDLRELLDESQHGVELALKMLDLVLGNRDARKMRHPADSIGVNGHASGPKTSNS
jgi:hypothetical protein